MKKLFLLMFILMVGGVCHAAEGLKSGEKVFYFKVITEKSGLGPAEINGDATSIRELLDEKVPKILEEAKFSKDLIFFLTFITKIYKLTTYVSSEGNFKTKAGFSSIIPKVKNFLQQAIGSKENPIVFYFCDTEEMKRDFLTKYQRTGSLLGGIVLETPRDFLLNYASKFHVEEVPAISSKAEAEEKARSSSQDLESSFVEISESKEVVGTEPSVPKKFELELPGKEGDFPF